MHLNAAHSQAIQYNLSSNIVDLKQFSCSGLAYCHCSSLTSTLKLGSQVAGAGTAARRNNRLPVCRARSDDNEAPSESDGRQIRTRGTRTDEGTAIQRSWDWFDSDFQGRTRAAVPGVWPRLTSSLVSAKQLGLAHCASLKLFLIYFFCWAILHIYTTSWAPLRPGP